MSRPSMSACLIESNKDWTVQDIDGLRQTLVDIFSGH